MSLKQYIKDIALVSTALNTSYAADRLDDINEKLDDMSSDISSKLSDANFHLNDINESIERFEKRTIHEISLLKQSVEKGFSDISLELAVQSDILKSIDRLLKNKVSAEAEEYKRFGINALHNKWFDDAKADFEKSIEINRYDYKVYYLLSKCYEGLGNRQKQDEYLEKAYHYAKNDPYFQQYIGLDIVGLLMKDGELDDAQEAALSIINTLPINKRNESPLLLCQLKINIKAKKINDETLSIINRLINSHDYKYQIKMMKVVMALTEDIDDDNKAKINNLLNLKKANLSKTCAKLLENTLNNSKDLITNYIRWNLKIIDLKIANKIMTSQKRIMELCLEDNYEVKINTVDDFNKYYILLCEATKLENSLMNIMKYKMGELLDIFKEMKKAKTVFYDFNVENDKIIWQMVDREDIISLSGFNLLITKNALSESHKPITYTYNIDSLDQLEFEKFMEYDAFEDFLKRYNITQTFDISFYKKLLSDNSFEPKKYYYILKDKSNEFDILTGTQYNYNNFISDDISDAFKIQKEEMRLFIVKKIKEFESVESILDKAYQLSNAYDIMRSVNRIFTSFINIIAVLNNKQINTQVQINNNEDIEFID